MGENRLSITELAELKMITEAADKRREELWAEFLAYAATESSDDVFIDFMIQKVAMLQVIVFDLTGDNNDDETTVE